MYDVVISGAGPAGSRCAEVFAKNGYKIALIERDTQWRKPCGGGVNSSLVKYYPKLREFDKAKKVAIKIYSADFSVLEHVYADTEDNFIMTDRLEFDNFVRDLAIDAGAELFDKNLSIDFVYNDNKRIGVATKTSEGRKEYRGKLIVVADGMSSKLATRSGLRGKWKSEEIGIAKATILEGENALDPNYAYTFLQAYKGYGWIFPIDDKRFNIGCGTFNEDNLNFNLNKIYSEFVNNPLVKNFISGSELKHIWSGAYSVPSSGVLENSLYDDNLMLIGDAGGFVSPIIGEGIEAGVLSGQVAAEVGSKALEIGDLSAKTLKKYRIDKRVKSVIRDFKLKDSLKDFFFADGGKVINAIFKIAEQDKEFEESIGTVFLKGQAPPPDFFSRIKDTINSS